MLPQIVDCVSHANLALKRKGGSGAGSKYRCSQISLIGSWFCPPKIEPISILNYKEAKYEKVEKVANFV